MANGTLTQWRKKQGPNKISEIPRLVKLLCFGDEFANMLAVAEGVKYLHSEGIIHGDLHGVRVPISCLPKLITLFTSVTSSSILNHVAKSPILGRLDISNPLLHILQQHLL